MLLGGRAIRETMIVGPEGRWRDEMWLDGVLARSAPPPEPAPEPRLTRPLPINSCSEDSLTLLPRVGPVLAGRIAAARREGVIFASPADLERVRGIGPALAARLESLVVFTPDSEPSAGR